MNPPPASSGVPGQRHHGALTWRFSLPVVTARARREPGVPDLMRTQRGPAAVPVRLVADASGGPVLGDQGPIGRPGTARPVFTVA
jgi:hypothetical protein